MLPKYAIGVAPLNIRTLEELSDACRRIDGVHNRQTVLRMPFQDSSRYGDRPFQRNFERSRELNAVEGESADEYTQDGDEIEFYKSTDIRRSAKQYEKQKIQQKRHHRRKEIATRVGKEVISLAFATGPAVVTSVTSAE